MKRSRGRIDLLDKDGRSTGARKQTRVKIAIAVPSRGVCPSNFAWSLANLVLHSGMALVTAKLADLTVGFNEGTYIHTNRNDLAGSALKEGADYILWLDDDMLFPHDALIALLEHNVSIVGANYPTRKFPITPVAIKYIGSIEDGHPPERLQTREGDTGLERVEAIGFGCVLIKAEVFWDVGFPWFENKRDEEMERWVGEDVDFCIKARAAGHDVFVDHGLSQEVRHIGQMEYSVAHAAAYEDETHGTDDVRGVANDDQQLAESERRDDTGDNSGLHPASRSGAES